MVQVHVAPIASGYTVDLCRTLFVGKVASEAARALESYLEAQAAGIAAARSGAPLPRFEDAMSAVLKKSGYGDAFLRPVFHGVMARPMWPPPITATAGPSSAALCGWQVAGSSRANRTSKAVMAVVQTDLGGW